MWKGSKNPSFLGWKKGVTKALKMSVRTDKTADIYIEENWGIKAMHETNFKLFKIYIS